MPAGYLVEMWRCPSRNWTFMSEAWAAGEAGDKGVGNVSQSRELGTECVRRAVEKQDPRETHPGEAVVGLGRTVCCQ